MTISASRFVEKLTVLLPPFLAAQRWFGPIQDPQLRIRRINTLHDGWPSLIWVLVEVTSGRNPDIKMKYQVPIGARSESPDHLPESALIGRLDTPSGPAYLFDALADDEVASLFGEFVAPDLTFSTVRSLGDAKANSSLVFDERYILKVLRRVRSGPNLDVEMTEALGRVGFGGVPVPVKVWRQGGADLAVLRRFEKSRGDGRQLALASLRELFNRRQPPRDCKLDFAHDAQLLGENVARFHVASAHAFGVEESTGNVLANDMLAQLQRVRNPVIDHDRIAAMYERLRNAHDLGSAIRIHGDLTLDTVLRLQRDWMVRDFEGESGRPVSERRRHVSPLRDIAGMTRSMQHAANFALSDYQGLDLYDSAEDEIDLTHVGQPDSELGVLAEAWVVRNINAFLSGYAEVDEAHRLLPKTRQSRDALLHFFELDKAVYEVAGDVSRSVQGGATPLRDMEQLLRQSSEL